MIPEQVRLKHITGFSKLFANREYNRAWVSRNQADVRRRYQEQAAAGRSAEAPPVLATTDDPPTLPGGQPEPTPPSATPDR